MASTSRGKQVMAASDWVSQGVTDAEKELIKAEYNEKLYAHFLSTRSAEECSKMTNLWSHDCLDPLILRIQKEKEKSGQYCTFIYNFNDKFMMVEISKGKERLFIKDDNGKFKVILPWEDTFDIFWETHLKYYHPRTETLKHILQDDYIVNDFAIQKIYEVCYKCSQGQQPYLRCALDIISLNGVADYAFSQIMICQDMYTGFIHLRPVSDDYKASEICLELLAIFMDFGPPKEVLITNDIFRVALDQIKQLTIYAPISIAILRVKEDKTKFKSIKNKMTNWMKKNEFDNWSIACYGMQAYLNNQCKGPGQKSAYDMVFKNINMVSIEDLDDIVFESLEPASSNDVNKDKSIDVNRDKSSDVDIDESDDVNTDIGVFTTFSPADFRDIEIFTNSSPASVATHNVSNKNSAFATFSPADFTTGNVTDENSTFTTFSPADFVTSNASDKNSAKPAIPSSAPAWEDEMYDYTDNLLFGSDTFDELMPGDDEDPLAVDIDDINI